MSAAALLISILTMGSFQLHMTEDLLSLRMRILCFHLCGARAGMRKILAKVKSQS